MINLRHDLGFIPERLIADLDPWDREAGHIAFKIQFFLTQREEEPETIETLKHPKTPKDAAKEYFLNILPSWIGAIARKRFRVQYTYTPVVLRKYNNCPHIITQDYQSHLAHLEGNLYDENRAPEYGRQASP